MKFALVYNGVEWCRMVRKPTKQSRPRERRRLSVSLKKADYARLVRIAENQRPQLSLRCVVELAVVRLLDDARMSDIVLRSRSDSRPSRAKK